MFDVGWKQTGLPIAWNSICFVKWVSVLSVHFTIPVFHILWTNRNHNLSLTVVFLFHRFMPALLLLNWSLKQVCVLQFKAWDQRPWDCDTLKLTRSRKCLHNFHFLNWIVDWALFLGNDHSFRSYHGRSKNDF